MIITVARYRQLRIRGERRGVLHPKIASWSTPEWKLWASSMVLIWLIGLTLVSVNRPFSVWQTVPLPVINILSFLTSIMVKFLCWWEKRLPLTNETRKKWLWRAVAVKKPEHFMMRFWGGVFHGVYLVRRKGDLEFEPSTAHVWCIHARLHNRCETASPRSWPTSQPLKCKFQ